MRFIGGKSEGHVWIGKLLVTWPVNNDGGPLLDACTTNLIEDTDDPTHKILYHHGGVAIRPLRCAVGWRGARMWNIGRWLNWRWALRHAWWVLRGRPSGRIRDLFPAHRVSSGLINFDNAQSFGKETP